MASSCVNEFENKLFTILRINEDLILKLGHLIKFYMRKIFIDYAGKVHQELFPELYFILVNCLKNSKYSRDSFMNKVF